jgi:hypothetical protein
VKCRAVARLATANTAAARREPLRKIRHVPRFSATSPRSSDAIADSTTTRFAPGGISVSVYASM